MDFKLKLCVLFGALGFNCFSSVQQPQQFAVPGKPAAPEHMSAALEDAAAFAKKELVPVIGAFFNANANFGNFNFTSKDSKFLPVVGSIKNCANSTVRNFFAIAKKFNKMAFFKESPIFVFQQTLAPMDRSTHDFFEVLFFTENGLDNFGNMLVNLKTKSEEFISLCKNINQKSQEQAGEVAFVENSKNTTSEKPIVKKISFADIGLSYESLSKILENVLVKHINTFGECKSNFLDFLSNKSGWKMDPQVPAQNCSYSQMLDVFVNISDTASVSFELPSIICSKQNAPVFCIVTNFLNQIRDFAKTGTKSVVDIVKSFDPDHKFEKLPRFPEKFTFSIGDSTVEEYKTSLLNGLNSTRVYLAQLTRAEESIETFFYLLSKCCDSKETKEKLFEQVIPAVGKFKALQVEQDKCAKQCNEFQKSWNLCCNFATTIQALTALISETNDVLDSCLKHPVDLKKEENKKVYDKVQYILGARDHLLRLTQALLGLKLEQSVFDLTGAKEKLEKLQEKLSAEKISEEDEELDFVDFRNQMQYNSEAFFKLYGKILATKGSFVSYLNFTRKNLRISGHLKSFDEDVFPLLINLIEYMNNLQTKEDESDIEEQVLFWTSGFKNTRRFSFG